MHAIATTTDLAYWANMNEIPLLFEKIFASTGNPGDMGKISLTFFDRNKEDIENLITEYLPLGIWVEKNIVPDRIGFTQNNLIEYKKITKVISPCPDI